MVVADILLASYSQENGFGFPATACFETFFNRCENILTAKEFSGSYLWNDVARKIELLAIVDLQRIKSLFQLIVSLMVSSKAHRLSLSVHDCRESSEALESVFEVSVKLRPARTNQITFDGSAIFTLPQADTTYDVVLNGKT